jgi:hypothetical protein
MGEVAGGGDERDMREGLREVADQTLGPRIVLLGEQPDIVAQCQQPFEQPPLRTRPSASLSAMRVSHVERLHSPRHRPSAA